MNKITDMFAKGEISVEDLVNASELMERARLVKKSITSMSEDYCIFPRRKRG